MKDQLCHFCPEDNKVKSIKYEDFILKKKELYGPNATMPKEKFDYENCGIYQYVNGDVYSKAWLDGEMFEEIKMRVYSTLENPNVYGEYLLFIIPIIAALLWTEKGWKKKLFYLVCLGITGIALILTFSRGCYLGIIFTIFILSIIIDKRFIFLGIALLLLSPFILPDAIINRFMSIGNMADSSTSYRVYIWMGTLAMLKDFWLSGVGMGITSFNTIYPIFIS